MTCVLRLVQLALCALIAAAAGGLIFALMLALVMVALGVLVDIVAAAAGARPFSPQPPC